MMVIFSLHMYQVAMTLDEQLDHFKEYRSKLKSLVGENETIHILSRGLVVVVAGSNDIANTYFGRVIRRSQYDINSYTDFLSKSAKDFMTVMYCFLLSFCS